jgi:predicted GIY-YIG superfamily endonuclease
MQTRHYTYLMICQETRQLYIGVRSSKVDPKLDKYQSSSAYIKRMISSGYTFKKRVLSEFSTRSEAVLHEIYLHSKYDVARSTRFLNKSKQTVTSFDRTGVSITLPPRTEEHRRNHIASLKGLIKSPEHIAKINLANAGKVRSEETRRKISEARKGRVMSPEQKLLLSQRSKERWARYAKEYCRSILCLIRMAQCP